MIRYILTLALYLPMQLLAYLITPILPAFASPRLGKSDNANAYLVEPRLPKFLAWLDTPDNSLFGDKNWADSHDGGYWSQVAWLYRNSLYGFKWSVLSREIQQEREVEGNPDINYHTKTFGTLRIKQDNGAWQYKSVKPFMGRILVLNLGWLLDDVSQPRALFMLSPRLK